MCPFLPKKVRLEAKIYNLYKLFGVDAKCKETVIFLFALQNMEKSLPQLGYFSKTVEIYSTARQPNMSKQGY